MDGQRSMDCSREGKVTKKQEKATAKRWAKLLDWEREAVEQAFYDRIEEIMFHGLCDQDLSGLHLDIADYMLRRNLEFDNTTVDKTTIWPKAKEVLRETDWTRVAQGDEKLSVAMMRYDAAHHPKPELFKIWAKGGGCPYASRCGNASPLTFDHNEFRSSYRAGKALSTEALLVKLLRAAGVKGPLPWD